MDQPEESLAAHLLAAYEPVPNASTTKRSRSQYESMHALSASERGDERLVVGEGFRDIFYRSKDGLKLHARVYGEVSHERLPAVCLPGLTRNVRDFHEIALYLSTHPTQPRQVVSFDYRGRGGSEYDPTWTNYNILAEADDVLAGLDFLEVQEALFIGTSRGGLIVHLIGAIKLKAIKGIVFNDIGPAIEASGFAHIKSYLENASQPETIRDAVDRLRDIHGSTFPALTDTDWERMAAAVYRIENGRPVADFDPNLVNTLASVDLTKPLPALWQQFDSLRRIPMMVIRGEHSRLLAPGTVTEMARRHPGMKGITVAGQGHPPMLETGDLPRQISAFLDEADKPEKQIPAKGTR
jgi:pimeloyl-ACP methyl ester carboxylesterase